MAACAFPSLNHPGGRRGSVFTEGLPPPGFSCSFSLLTYHPLLHLEFVCVGNIPYLFSPFISILECIIEGVGYFQGALIRKPKGLT